MRGRYHRSISLHKGWLLSLSDQLQVPESPCPLAGSRVRESAARNYWVEIRLVLSAASTSQVLGDAADVPGTAPSPAPLAQPHGVSRSALLAQLFVRCP